MRAAVRLHLTRESPRACKHAGVASRRVTPLRLAIVAALALLAVAVANAAAPGIRSTDWNTVTLPGAVCGASAPIHLVDGQAVVDSSRWRGIRRVLVSREQTVAYGDLSGSGDAGAALGVICSNDGGTAAGQLAFAQVVFGLTGSTLRVIGIVTPRHPNPGRHPSLLTAKVAPGGVIATELFYGRNDGDCCPSGRATTRWLYSKGGLTPQPTVVTREPAK
jgi:hypothetical protein